MQLLQIPAETETIRVSALHALAYCPRLYYLEEVEELYTQAAPLALDLMEIFRVPLVDMIVVASINRQQWDVNEDFEIRGEQVRTRVANRVRHRELSVWLSDTGRRKFVGLYEQRKQETWKHPVTKYSLTYRRLLELEVRLLEKEWMGEAGLFGQLIVR